MLQIGNMFQVWSESQAKNSWLPGWGD